jgi:hypothetical protein
MVLVRQMGRTRTIALRSLVKCWLIFFVIVLVLGCGDRDRCEPPFSGGMGTSGILPEGPVEAGKTFGMVVVIYASYVAEIQDAEIVVALPPELEIDAIVQPKNGPKVEQAGNTLRWKGDIKPSFYRSLMGLPKEYEFTLWLKSRTDWKQWRHPVEIDMSLYFTSNGECRNFPDGYYRKKLTWSYEGYNYPDWQEKPE